MRYDLHLHTKYSPDSVVKPTDLLKKAKKKKLNGIAVTDHNTIKGSIETSKLNQDKDFEVIIASEIRTNKADILAYYLNKNIKPGDFFEVMDKIKEQDALAVIAHPFSFWRTSLKLPFAEIKNLVDGIECFNGRSIFPFENSKASRAADNFNLAKIGNSDAHTLYEVGQGYTVFEDNLRKAINKRETKAKGIAFHAYPIYPYTVLRKIKSLF